jgi:3-phosphoshikimate 1-carboxyvinyltransferase
MKVTVTPGGVVSGSTWVPGDKSIAHRWLLLAATATGRSELRGLPDALDVRSTARVLAELSAGDTRGALEAWASEPAPVPEGDGSTTNGARPRPVSVAVEARGRGALEAPTGPLDCGNSGTTMRLVPGMLASAPFRTVLTGDSSLTRRPMERVAKPLRAMGATVATQDGHAPVEIEGADLHGIRYRPDVPSAQVKSAVLLAGLDADGVTVVEETAPTRDHTERALASLGAPVSVDRLSVSISRFQHGGFSGTVPGDLSSAVFAIAAAALTGGRLEIVDIGLNPSRTSVLGVLERMGMDIVVEVEGEELGEPVGRLVVEPRDGMSGTTVLGDELPLVIDEIPALAVLAAAATGESRFAGAGELRLKESDRLGGLASVITALGGHAAVEGDDLVVAGGGLDGGAVDAGDDHRVAMAAFVAALGAARPVTVEGIEAADVSFPGFVATMRALGAEVAG